MKKRCKDAVLRKWEELPEFMRLPQVRPYWEILDSRRTSLVCKRMFDLTVGSILLAVLVLPLFVISIVIKLDSPGPVFYRQERVTAYGRLFWIHKFRTMTVGADKNGIFVTAAGDSRMTRAGRFLRKYRLDELPQLIDIIAGDMSFVGTRPEVAAYVRKYAPAMRATLLLPAGVTSEASIWYKDEDKLLATAKDVQQVYIEQVLPDKMKLNLEALRKFSLSAELWTMLRTILAVLGCL